MIFVLGLCLGGAVGVLMSAMARAAASDTIREHHESLLTIAPPRNARRSVPTVDPESNAVNTGRYAIIETRRTG